jgi:hypothetical protein
LHFKPIYCVLYRNAKKNLKFQTSVNVDWLILLPLYATKLTCDELFVLIRKCTRKLPEVPEFFIYFQQLHMLTSTFWFGPFIAVAPLVVRHGSYGGSQTSVYRAVGSSFRLGRAESEDQRPEEIFKFRVSEMPFPGLWGRFDRILTVRKQRFTFSMSKFTGKYGPDCKVLFLRGELFVVNGSCAEMKAEHLRKFRSRIL